MVGYHHIDSIFICPLCLDMKHVHASRVVVYPISKFLPISLNHDWHLVIEEILKNKGNQIHPEIWYNQLVCIFVRNVYKVHINISFVITGVFSANCRVNSYFRLIYLTNIFHWINQTSSRVRVINPPAYRCIDYWGNYYKCLVLNMI